MGRLQAFKNSLKKPIVLENPIDLYYLCGIRLSKGRLLVTSEKVTLFVDGRYYHQAKKSVSCDVEPWGNFEKISLNEVGFDSSFSTFDTYQTLTKLHPQTKWLPVSNPLKEQRVIKDAGEIEALKKAAKLTLEGIEHIKKMLKPGITEDTLAFEFEMFVRSNGAERLSFDPIIAFGENSAHPHYRAGKAKLQSGQIVLIDAGAVLNGYSGDLTRIVHFGTPDSQILEFEKLVKQAQTEAISLIQPKVNAAILDQRVREIFEEAGVLKLYTHSLGHGIGLETHEYPILRFDREFELESGMVFTVEPGLYQPGVGGVRLEEMVLVTESGAVQFCE